MSRFPKIDQPCPLGVDEQKRLDGFCTRCEKHVYTLDTLTIGAREALLRSASGPICVSYRMPAPRRSARFGAAIALAMVVLPAAATDVAPAIADPGAETVAPPTALSEALHPAQVKCHDADAAAPTPDPQVSWETITVGGVSHPGDAEWVDADDSLADLPFVVERAPERR